MIVRGIEKIEIVIDNTDRKNLIIRLGTLVTDTDMEVYSWALMTNHANRLTRILDRLNAANEIKDMNYPDSFLHQLSGDKKGLHTVKVSGNWRVFLKLFQCIE